MADSTLTPGTKRQEASNSMSPVPSPLWLVTKPGRNTPNGWLGDVYTDRQEALRMAMRGHEEVVVELRLERPSSETGEQQPVAWMTEEDPPRVASADSRDGMHYPLKRSFCVPLYTHAQKAKVGDSFPDKTDV
jgi:hypothetical protein